MRPLVAHDESPATSRGRPSPCYHGLCPPPAPPVLGMIDPQERFQDLLDEMGELLRRVIARNCPKHLGLDPEDFEQEVRLRIWRLVQDRGQVEHHRSYLYRVAMNATVDAIRKVKRRREDSLSSAQTREAVEHESATALDAIGRTEGISGQGLILQAVEHCLSGLRERRGLAARLYLQGFTVPEIADLKCWTRASARNLVFRGMRDLRRCLRTKGYSDECF